MQIDTATAQQLGWPVILEHWCGLTCTPQGQALCRARKAEDDEQKIDIWQKMALDLNRLQDEGKAAPIDAVELVSEDLHRAAKGGVLHSEALLRLAEAMLVSSRVRRYLMVDGNLVGTALVDLARGSHDLQGPGRDLKAAFDEDGNLRDSASPELQQLRRSERNLADGIRARLERMMHTTRMAACLQEDYITQRGDRYVLPVRSDSRGEVPGLVHDTSGSGATLFIEPTEIIDSGNKLKIAKAAVNEEIKRILAEYSREVVGHTQALMDNLAMLAEFDALNAAVALGRHMDARFIEVGGEGFDLRQARHPAMVLMGQKPIANDIHLPEGRKALLISGPNAGGKTVAMKTLGLASLMAQRGLPVPVAEGSRICRFGHIAAVIGDAQDISQGLSTFSAHVKRIALILENTSTRSLVLLDEIAADTDPQHGAALACSILESLVDRGAIVLATTHYEELKHLPFADERFANASVGFDLEHMEPNFILHPEVPGRSLTLDIARRLGMPEAVLERAAARLDGKERQLDAVLQGLDHERQELNDLRGQLEIRQEQSKQARDEHREAADSLRKRKTELLGKGREALLSEIATVRRQVAGVIESMRQPGPMKDVVDASRKLIGLEEKVSQAAKKPEPNIEGPKDEEPKLADLNDLAAGDQVLLTTMGQEAQVTSVDRKTGMVSLLMGIMRTRAGVDKLRLLKKAPLRKKPSQDSSTKNPKMPSKAARPIEIRSSQNTLDLRGTRVDEALDQVDRFLDEMFGQDQAAAFIIHGHGTGALRAAIRDLLKTSPYPRHFRAGTQEEGGDGVTVVILK
ncbi:MAG: Smr/MutS family protein [Deltaproteobacteria bacterium]|nr:Smr/MutS family protein [Deltaproteobacteria bacterium]